MVNDPIKYTHLKLECLLNSTGAPRTFPILLRFGDHLGALRLSPKDVECFLFLDNVLLTEYSSNGLYIMHTNTLEYLEGEQ